MIIIITLLRVFIMILIELSMLINIMVCLHLLMIFIKLYEDNFTGNVLPAVYKYRCNSGLEMDGPDTVRFFANLFVFRTLDRPLVSVDHSFHPLLSSVVTICQCRCFVKARTGTRASPLAWSSLGVPSWTCLRW